MDSDHYASSDLGEVEQFLRATYTDLSLRPGGDRAGFRFRHDTVTEGAITLSRLSSTVAFGAHVAALDDVVVSDLREGRATWFVGGRAEVRAAGGDVGLSSRSEEHDVLLEPSEVDVVVLDGARVADYAAHTCGTAPEALGFTALTPLSPGMTQYWRATVEHVRTDILGAPVMAADPIIVESAFRSLAAVLLSTFPNTALDAATDPEGRGVTGAVAEATLREVADFLDAHAGEPLGPGDLARAADVPYRELVAGLRRRRDTHPATLLWAARLRGAHHDLGEADPATGDTVAVIAARWGFADLGSFRVAYTMATGGETPERTLGR